MKNLNSALEGKTLEELEINIEKPETGSSLIDPTIEHIEKVIDALRNGKGYLWIKRNIKAESGKKLSEAQIKEIEIALKRKIAELTPSKEVK